MTEGIKTTGSAETELTFFDVKTHSRVTPPRESLTKVTWKSPGRSDRYGVRTTYQGRTLTRFMSFTDYQALDVPEEIVTKDAA